MLYTLSLFDLKLLLESYKMGTEYTVTLAGLIACILSTSFTQCCGLGCLSFYSSGLNKALANTLLYAAIHINPHPAL